MLFDKDHILPKFSDQSKICERNCLDNPEKIDLSIESVKSEGSWSDLKPDGKWGIWLQETEMSKAFNLSCGSFMIGQPFDHLDFLLLFVSECWVGRPSGKLSHHRMSIMCKVIFHEFEILSQLVVHRNALRLRPWTFCGRRIYFFLFCSKKSWPSYVHTQTHVYANYTRFYDIY